MYNHLAKLLQSCPTLCYKHKCIDVIIHLGLNSFWNENYHGFYPLQIFQKMAKPNWRNSSNTTSFLKLFEYLAYFNHLFNHSHFFSYELKIDLNRDTSTVFCKYLYKLSLSVGDGQGSLACFSPWSCKELDMTE